MFETGIIILAGIFWLFSRGKNQGEQRQYSYPSRYDDNDEDYDDSNYGNDYKDDGESSDHWGPV